jgi:glycosyltransferase involved in cell wall biosynthesis
MKVLFISSWYPSDANPLQGVFVKKHAAAIASAGVEVIVLALVISHSSKLSEKKITEFTDENGVKTILITFNSRFYKLFYVNLFWQYHLLKKAYSEKIVPGFKAEIIHSNVLFPAGILAYWLSKELRLPHIITEHWSQVSKFMSKSLFASQGRKAYNEAKAVTVVSDFLKDSIREFFNAPEKIKIIPNVIDTKTFSYKEKIKKENEISFICVASWRSPKRPDLIFESLQRFSSGSKKQIVLNVVGEGSLLDDLKKREWNFKINYSGNLDSEALAEAYKRSDFFLHASDTETFSIVTAEALSMGTPALVSKAGALPDLVNEKNGILCENDIEAWIKGLEKLTSSAYDPKEISQSVQKFGAGKIGEEFKKLYSQVV